MSITSLKMVSLLLLFFKASAGMSPSNSVSRIFIKLRDFERGNCSSYGAIIINEHHFLFRHLNPPSGTPQCQTKTKQIIWNIPFKHIPYSGRSNQIDLRGYPPRNILARTNHGKLLPDLFYPKPLRWFR